MHPLYKDDGVTGGLRAEYQASSEEAGKLWAEFDQARKESGIEEALTKGQRPDTAVMDKLNRLKKTYEAAADRAGNLHDRLLNQLGKTTRNHNQGGLGGVSIGKAFIDGVGQKALDGTSGGSLVPPYADSGIILDMPSRALFVRSLIPVRQADSDKVWYLRQSAFTNLAAPVAAGADKPKSVLTVERIERPVTTIAHISEAMDRALLSDYEELVSFIDRQMTLGVLLSEEMQIISGDGVGVNLLGITATPGIQTYARLAAESPADALHKGITKVSDAFHQVDGICLASADWENIRLSKTADGEYLAGDIIQSDPERLWGRRVVVSPVVTAGTAIVGAFGEAAVLWDREQARLTFSESGLADVAGKDLFSRNQLRFRAEERIAFGVTRPAGFCKVTLT